ncbi:MAG: histidine kinase [Cyclobacteriaceae bacterium]
MKDRENTSLTLEGLLKVYQKYRLLWHLLFWVSYVAYESVVWGMVDNDYGRRLFSSLFELPFKMITAYFTLYVLIDRYLVKKIYARFFFYSIVSVLITVLSMRAAVFYVIYARFYPELMETIPLFWAPKLLITFAYLYSVVGIAAGFHMVNIWLTQQLQTQKLIQTAEKLEKENATAQLQLLKSQINPHFLFNTLNNLYALALSKSDKTPEVVHKLSELMNFMLYESNKEMVKLEKEIKYLEDFIALEKIRYDDKTDVKINISGNIDGVNIPPFLCLPLVENGFKHGLSRQLDVGWMHIDIGVLLGELIIKVENTTSNDQEIGTAPSGVGQTNLKQRLALIYPDRHSLKIMEGDNSYLVVLKIQLDNA